MVEHSFTNVSIHGCLSKSSSFYLEQQQQQQVEVNDLKAVVSNELSNLTPTGSPDDEDEYSPQNLRRKSSSSLFFNTKLQESLNNMNQQQKNPIFQLGQDEDEDDDDDDYYDDYSDRICKELSIDQEFNYTLDRIDSNNSISRLMLNTEIKSLKISSTTTTSAPIDMRKATAVCTDMDDQALSSTLKETSNMVISSSSGSSSGGDTNVVGKNIESNKTKVKKNSRKRRQKKQQQIESPKTKEAVQKSESLPVDIKKPTSAASKQIESPLQDEDIFAGFPGQGFEFYLDDDIDSDGCLNDHHMLSEEADDKPSILINKHHGSFKKAKKAFIASELELDDPAYTTNDEDSSSADYFLASSVDTVIMAPYLRAANFGRVAAAESSSLVPTNTISTATAPAVFGKELTDNHVAPAPYTSSIASNFLYSLDKANNHVNNNNNNNSKFSKHHEANNSIPNSFNSNSQNSKGSCFNLNKFLLFKKPDKNKILRAWV